MLIVFMFIVEICKILNEYIIKGRGLCIWNCLIVLWGVFVILRWNLENGYIVMWEILEKLYNLVIYFNFLGV